MARPKKSEGTEVRHAMNGPDIDHDKLIANIAARNAEDAERASSAGESRQSIGDFLEKTGMNAKAYSVCRTILKFKKVEKAMDMIRSLESALPMVKAHLGGQQGEMDLEPDVTDTEVEPEAAPVLSRPTYGADGHLGDPEIADETDDFDKALAEVASA